MWATIDNNRPADPIGITSQSDEITGRSVQSRFFPHLVHIIPRWSRILGSFQRASGVFNGSGDNRSIVRFFRYPRIIKYSRERGMMYRYWSARGPRPKDWSAQLRSRYPGLWCASRTDDLIAPRDLAREANHRSILCCCCRYLVEKISRDRSCGGFGARLTASRIENAA